MPESAKSMQHTFCKSIWLKSHHDVAAQLQITMERGRFQGTAAELCNALAPHAVHKSFVKYDESKDLMKAKVAADMKQIILAHAPILQSIHELQPNLSIPKKVCISALQLLVDQKSSQWEMETRHHADWVATMEVRLRNLLRVVSQGILKNRIWTSNLPWTTTPASPTIVSEAAPEFFFSFDSELCKAIRTPVSAPGKQEPNKYFKEPRAAQPEDAMVAVWPDGMARLLQYTSGHDMCPGHYMLYRLYNALLHMLLYSPLHMLS